MSPIDAGKDVFEREDNLLDREIKRRVQAVESEIPAALEQEIFGRLDGITVEPEGGGRVEEKTTSKVNSKARSKGGLLFLGSLAAAASIFLAGFMVYHTWFSPVPGPTLTAANHGELLDEGTEAFLDFARVEGMPATTYIVRQQDPGIKIIWIEKATVTANRNTKAKGIPNGG